MTGGRQMDRASALEQEFDRLLFEVSGKIEAGEQIDADEIVDANPRFAARLRELLPTLLAMNELGHVSRTEISNDAAGSSEPESQEASMGLLGDFRILREIGRGGMGVVYEAEQISLSRRVALKILPFASVLDSRQLQRFKNEALAAAQLDHPHIVNVYGVGCERSVHYYAMRLIEGRSLSQLILTFSEQSTVAPSRDVHCVETITLAGSTISTDQKGRAHDFFQAVARMGSQIADALDFAHQQGIVHRDIKPANLIVDEIGKTWVTDFGLAQMESVPALTLTGDLVGTLRYMSPEQVLAKRVIVDHRTDIYSLGITLYEIATLQPAFSDKNRQELIRMIAFEEPIAPRQIAKSMPFELETIIQKAIAKNPSERYASAADMAEDLKLFLDNKPIRARRPSTLDRMVKWSRRHRHAVMWIVTLLIGMTLVSSLSAVWLAAERAQVIRAEREKTESLWDAYLSQAHALRHSGKPGQRFETLTAIRNATQLIPVGELTNQQRRRLRNEAISAMSLPDVRLDKEVDVSSNIIALDSRFERIAAADAEGTIRIRELKNDRLLMTLKLDQPVSELMFEPQGRYLLAKYQAHADAPATTCVWNLSKQQKLLELDTSARGRMDFSDDGDLFAVVLPDNSVGIFELPTGKAKYLDVRDDFQPLQLKFHPDRKYLALGQILSGEVQIHNLDHQRPPIIINNPAATYTMDWHPSGQFLAIGGSDFLTRVWDIRDWSKPISELRGHQGEVIDVAFESGGSLLATTSHDGTFRLWDARTGRPECQATGRFNRFNRNGDRLSVFRGRGHARLEIWEVADGDEMRSLLENRMYKGPFSLEISANGRLMATSGDDGIWLWDLQAGQVIHRIEIPGRTAFFYDSANELITISKNGVLAWSLNNSEGELRIGAPRKLSEVETPSHMCWGALSHSANKLAFVGRPDEIVVWDLKESREVFRKKTNGYVQAIAMSEDGRWLVTSGNCRQIWDMQSDRNAVKLEHPGGYPSCRFSLDNKYLITGTTDDIRVWEVETWRQLRRFPLTDALHTPIAFSPDGRMTAIVESRSAIQLLDMNTWQKIGSIQSHFPQQISKMAFTPDGAILVVASETNVIQLWDLDRIWKQLRQLGLESGTETSLSDKKRIRMLDHSVPPLKVTMDH